jgi:YcxB-like protein
MQQMITTKKFDLTKNEYLSVILKVLVKKKWWHFLICWAFAIFLTFEADKNGLNLFCMFFLYIYPLILAFEYWRFANAKDNRKIFGERYYEISTEQINAYLANGSNSIIKFEQFVKTFELKDYYFLYISKSQSLYFPKRIFKSTEDLDWFKKNIFDKVS